MRFLVFGTGSIGSAIGGFLSKRNEVSLLGRDWHINSIRRRGLRITGIWGNHTLRKFKELYTDEKTVIREKPEFDYILVTTKTNDTLHAAKVISKIITPDTYVVSLQNGLGNIEALKQYIPLEKIIAGRVIFGVVLGKGAIEVTVFGDKTLLGAADGKKGFKAAQKLSGIFNECGLETLAVKNILPHIWAKVIYNCALNPLATILQSSYGELLKTDATKSVMEEITREIYAVAKKNKIGMIPRTPGGYIKLLFGTLIPRTAAHHPSMLQAINHGKRTEINSLNGAIVDMGYAQSVPTPVNEVLTKLIKAKEKLRKA
jgi:2-dehydropantoate 2-reductase